MNSTMFLEVHNLPPGVQVLGEPLRDTVATCASIAQDSIVHFVANVLSAFIKILKKIEFNIVRYIPFLKNILIHAGVQPTGPPSSAKIMENNM